MTGSAEDFGRAKQGAGFLGRLAVDAYGNAVQLGTDVAIGKALNINTKIPLALRALGSGAYEAEQGGGNLAQQAGYGAASAGVEVLTEMMFDGLAGAFGKGAADDIVEAVVSKLGKTDAGKNVLRLLANAGGEGIEEIISSAVNPILRSIYNGQTPLENYKEENVTDWLYDGLVGMAVGGLGGGVDIARGGMAAKNAMLSPQAQDVVKLHPQSPALQDIAPTPHNRFYTAKNATCCSI